MKCPYCSSDNTRVIDSRPAEDNCSIRRRRLCDDCSKRFTTYEKVETIPLIIIKKDNTREQYNRSKIEDIRDLIGADSLGYLRIERLKEMVSGLPICEGCFTGTYPLAPPTEDIRGEYER